MFVLNTNISRNYRLLSEIYASPFLFYVEYIKQTLSLNRLLSITKSRQFKIISIGAIAFMGVLFIAWGIIYFQRPIKPVYSLNNLKIDSPIAINFSQPVQKAVSYNITPSINGVWKTSKNLFGITALKFYPAKQLTPGSKYKLTVRNIKPILASKPSSAYLSIPISTEKPATIDSFTPATDAKDILINSSVSVRLSSSNHGLRKLILKADAPLISEDPSSDDDITFTWKFAQSLRQGQTYHLSITDMKQTDKNKQILLTTSFKTVAEPQLKSATNTDHFYPGNKVSISFDQDMKQTDGIFKFGFQVRAIGKILVLMYLNRLVLCPVIHIHILCLKERSQFLEESQRLTTCSMSVHLKMYMS